MATPPNQRRKYRVSPGADSGVGVSVQISKDVAMSGEVLDLSIDGAGLSFLGARFASRALPPFGVGQEVTLGFSGAKVKGTVHALAQVVHRTNAGAACVYGFRFIGGQEHEKQLMPRMFALFSRRSAYRVIPTEETPIQVTLETKSPLARVQAKLDDISASGMGVNAPAEAEGTLATIDRTDLRLTLPNRPEPICVHGIIRNRWLAGAEIKYGIEFDFEHTQDRKQQLDAVVGYMMDRRQAMLSHPD